MRGFWFGLISFGCVAGATFAGCGDVPEQPTGPTSTSTSGGGSVGSGGKGTGGAGGCKLASDCGADMECVVRTCSGGICGTADVPMGMAATTQVAGDCEKKVCDGKGNASETPDDTDLPDGGTLCTENLCMNGSPAFPPVSADTPCTDHGGKVCDGAGKCVGCVGDADCPGGACSMSTCVGATCADHVQDGTETDVDCGGSSCPGCIAGKNCMVGSDCHDGVCTGGTCQVPSCTDMVKNGNETAVDCGGGTCNPCPNGDACFVPADCTSGFCVGGLCSKLLNGCDPATATDLTGMAGTTIAFGGATGDMYSPPCIKVSVGTVVTFNGDFTTHPLQGGVVGVSATADATGPLAMPTSAGMTAPFAMTVAGSYGFYCLVHWPLGMKGAIFVH